MSLSYFEEYQPTSQDMLDSDCFILCSLCEAAAKSSAPLSPDSAKLLREARANIDEMLKRSPQ